MRQKLLKYIGWAFPTLLLILLNMCGEVYYSEVDDYIMNFIGMGGNTEQARAHLLFVNYFLGYVLKGLYNIYDGINWYGVAYLLIIWGTTYMFFYIMNRYVKFWIAFISVIYLEVFMLNFLTFTVMAYISMGVALIGGIDYVIDSWHDQTHKIQSIWKILAIVVLFDFGYMIRSATFLSFVLVAVPFCIFHINRKNWKKAGSIILLLSCSVITLWSVHAYAYSSDLWEEWHTYSEYRAHIHDYPKAEYATHQDKYEALGLSENDYKCIDAHVFCDKEFFSTERFKAVSEINSFTENYNIDIGSILSEMIKMEETGLFFIVVFVFVLFSVGRIRIFFVVQSLFTYGVVGLLFFRNRPVERVMMPLYLLGILFMLYVFVRTQNIKEELYKKILLVIGMGLFIGGFWYNCLNMAVMNVVKKECEQKYHIVREYMQQNPDNLYTMLVWDKNNIFYKKPIMEIHKDITSSNLLSLGEWDIYNDIYYDMVKKYHLTYEEKLMLDLVEDENVFLIVSDRFEDKVEVIQTYIEEHTQRMVDMIVEDELKEAKVKIYRVRYKGTE